MACHDWSTLANRRDPDSVGLRRDSRLARVGGQVEVAKELNDPERVINREIKLKELYLDANGPNFVLSKLPQLRSPEEWAAMKSFTGK